MALACPQCNSPVAREGQRFCYRCGNDLRQYYESLNMQVTDEPAKPDAKAAVPEQGARPGEPAKVSELAKEAERPSGEQTIVMQPAETPSQSQAAPNNSERKATLRVLLSSGDVFDREITQAETQMGKGPRNDIVIADPAVSTSHAAIRAERGVYTISDLGSRNGTYVNGERITEPRKLGHGDVIGLGLSKLTFRLSDIEDTGAIHLTEVLNAPRIVAPPPLTEESLAQAVIAEGLVAKGEVERLRGPGAKGRRLYSALLDEQLVSEEGLRDLMSRTFQIQTVDLRTAQVDEALAAKLSSRIARDYAVFPFAAASDRLILAVTDPTDTKAVEEVKGRIRKPVELRLTTRSEVAEQIERHYGPKLIGVLPSGEKLEYPMNQKEVEIGKARHNHIVLTDPTVSNTHAVILVRDGGYSIVDLGSRNGTFVNGERLATRAHTLRHGDAIQMGQTVFTFRNPEETPENVTATLSPEVLEEIRKRAGVTEGTRTDESPVVELPAPAAASVQAATPAAAQGEDEKAEKKKKKKKKEKDERIRAAYVGAVSRVIAQISGAILTAAMTVGVAYYFSQRSATPTGQGPNAGDSRGRTPVLSFNGGEFEASGVAYVPGTEGVLFVDDSKPGKVFWMRIDQSGNQVGDVTPISLNNSVTNPEGITYDGTYFYITSSLAEPDAAGKASILRFAFDPASQQVSGQAEAVTDLRNFLLNNLPALGPEGAKRGYEGGLNVEGIAWDQAGKRLLLGLRSPLVNGQAVVVPLKVDNSQPFANSNISIAESGPILLPLGGLGIRDIQYDGQSKKFLIISGALDTQKKTDFRLWEWSGDGGQSGAGLKLREDVTLDEKIKPEGITRVKIDSRSFVFVVGDASYYLKLDDRQ